MAKYGEFLYGTAKYGTGAADPQPAPTGAKIKWIIGIDWDGNGFNGENEGLYCVGMTIKRGREFFVSAGADDFETMEIGDCSLTMENIDGRYDPYNLTSPLYPHVKPGRRIRIANKETADGTNHYVFTGHISDIKPASSGDNQVIISCSDGMQYLKDQDVAIGMSLHTTISEAINNILTKAKYPFFKVISPWAQPIPIFDADEYNAQETINSLASASLGNFFVAADGKAKYYPLNYNSQPTYTLDQAQLLKEIQVGTPWENVRNNIKVHARRRAVFPLAIIWETAGAIEVAANSIYDMDISFNASVGIKTSLVRLKDYDANTAADGTGYAIAASISVSIDNIGMTSASLHIVNSYPGVIYVTWLQVWGCELTECKVTFSAVDGQSINDYGTRRFELENDWLQDSGYAKAFAAIIRDGLGDPQKNPIIQIESREDIQYDMDLMDKITLTVAKLGISKTYYVGGIEHEWLNENGQSVKTILYLQEVLYSSTAITADPYCPSIPTVTNPVITTPYGTTPTDVITPEPTPTPPVTTDCATDVDAGTNGPYSLYVSGYLESVSGHDSVTVEHNCVIRNDLHKNRSMISITGSFEKTTDGGNTWTAIPDNDFYVVEAIDPDGEVVDTAVMNAVTDSGTGTRTGVFGPPSSVDVANFRIRLTDGQSYYYIYGKSINGGPIPVTNEEGVQLLDNSSGESLSPDGYALSAGQIYVVDGVYGPWYYSGVQVNGQYGIQVGRSISGYLDLVVSDTHGTATATGGTTGAFSIDGAGSYVVFTFGEVPIGSTIYIHNPINMAFCHITLSGSGGSELVDQYYQWEPSGYTCTVPVSSVKIELGYVSTAAGNPQVYSLPVFNYGDGTYKDTDIVTPNQRIYFAANAAGDWVRVEDTPGEYADNSTPLFWFDLHRGGVAGTIRMTIQSIMLYNVCPPI